jgi:hypothetical protein
VKLRGSTVETSPHFFKLHRSKGSESAFSGARVAIPLSFARAKRPILVQFKRSSGEASPGVVATGWSHYRANCHSRRWRRTRGARRSICSSMGPHSPDELRHMKSDAAHGTTHHCSHIMRLHSNCTQSQSTMTPRSCPHSNSDFVYAALPSLARY